MKKTLRITGKILVWILGIIAGLVIISALNHNISKSMEKNKYKIGQTVHVDGKNMHAYVTASPIADFMPLAERLSEDYKVVILESFGYGFSDTTKKERSNETIVNEIRSALKELEITGPYILMPHSISGVYSMYYEKNYPDEVEAIIGIDESVPNQTKTDKNDNMSPNLTMLNTLGILRNLSYLSPSADDGMNKENYYSAEQVKLKKMATIWNSLNISVINEMNTVNANTKELYDVKYPNDLPVLAFLSKDTEDTDQDWLSLHEELISNDKIQKVETLSGGHYLHWTNADKIAEMTKEFISTHLN
ncbi:alpha/beta hydrolase [Lacrimispora xylanolytica]